MLLYGTIATIPVGLVGVLFKDVIEQMFSSNLVVGIALLITGTILFVTQYFQGNNELNWKNTTIIGISQASALVPGISRSGTTISIGLLQGIDGEKAARFSFLLSIPAILGASLLNIKEITQAANLNIMLYGFIASIITGYISIKLLLKIIKVQKFHYFSYYCWFLGVLLIVLV
jgi:undecaprenyl-diphosphatase